MKQETRQLILALTVAVETLAACQGDATVANVQPILTRAQVHLLENAPSYHRLAREHAIQRDRVWRQIGRGVKA